MEIDVITTEMKSIGRISAPEYDYLDILPFQGKGHRVFHQELQGTMNFWIVVEPPQ